MLNIIAWIILGVIAGAIAKALYPGRQGGGFVATTLLGIAGAFVGGTLLTFLQTGRILLTGASLSIPGIFVAVLGAMIFIFVWGLINKAD